VRWWPRPQNNAFISAEHGEEEGGTDFIVTAGERHLKFWSFRRQTRREGPALCLRSYSMGKVTAVEAPKVHRCVVVLDPSADKAAAGAHAWDAVTPRRCGVCAPRGSLPHLT